MVENLRDAFEILGVDWVLWLLAALSVWSIAIIVERWHFFRRYNAQITTVETLVRGVLGANSPAAATKAAQEAESQLKAMAGMEAHVLAEALGHLHMGAQALQEIIAGSLTQERLKHDRNLTVLGTLGNNAPFIGLFGTVVAIVSAFHQLEVGIGSGSAAERNEMLMGSISEALVATAVGLLVAIPAVIAFNYFKSQIRKRSARTEALSRLVLAYASSNGARKPSSSQEPT